MQKQQWLNHMILQIKSLFKKQRIEGRYLNCSTVFEFFKSKGSSFHRNGAAT